MKKIILMMIAFSLMLFADNIKLTAESCVTQLHQTLDQIGQGKIKLEDGNKLIDNLCSDGCGKACISLTMTKTGISDIMQLKDQDLKEGCEVKFPYGKACYLRRYTDDMNNRQMHMKKGCEFGHGMACYWLGNESLEDSNYADTIKYYDLACDLGDDESCGTLAKLYAMGKLGEKVNDQNDKKAYEYWKKSLKLNPNNDVSKDSIERLCKYNPSVCK